MASYRNKPMSLILFDIELGPKRGDIIQTACGTKRERTWMVLRSRKVKRKGSPRYKVFMARWWELEEDMRMKLFRSAERNGGQIVFWFQRYAVKRKSGPEGLRGWH